MTLRKEGRGNNYMKKKTKAKFSLSSLKNGFGGKNLSFQNNGIFLKKQKKQRRVSPHLSL